jgi:starch phosphorylase
VPQNTPEDAEITFQLYGGDSNTRIQQEIILGIGGLRMLRRLNIAPTVFHMNEGHAAFLILERLRELIKSGLPYTQALEVTASNSVFTTHTPVPAGHDHFQEHLMMHYLGGFAQDLGLSWEQFMALGRLPSDGPDFNMTTLAIQGSRKINGVSRIHGRVSSEICAKFWTEISPEENPVDYVTNGVHVSSFLARQWSDLFDKHLGSEWRERLCDSTFWERIEEVPDKEFWSVKQAVKSRMLVVVRNALISQHLRAQNSETHIESVLKNLDPDNPNVLTVGFARRFATYKRATLLLNDLQRLRKILSVTDCPIVFVFAGKAHPADEPGKSLLRALYRLSNEPEFIGKIVVVQGYDMGLGRRLVSGVDVWLNNPVYPLEASGTSGMKAAINGAINLSITDGWWAEGYEGDNGWNIRPSPHQEDGRRDHEDARNLYDILENEVIPLYYDRDKRDYSSSWVEKSKRSMTSVIPRFNMVRMLNEYLDKFYIPAGLQGRRFSADNFSKARQLADWKSKVRSLWKNVQVHLLTAPQKRLSYDEPVTIEAAIRLNGLDPHDVAVELLLSRKLSQVDTGVMPNVSIKSSWESESQVPTVAYRFTPERPLDNGEYLYRLTFQPDWCGVLKFKIRIFPFHDLLTDPHEMGMMVWA